MSKSKISRAVLDRICSRAHYLAQQMIYLANTRKDKEKGDPKVGGHPSASASALHILGALHLVVKSGYDHIAVKPHASPTDHSFNYLLDLFLTKELERFSLEDKNQAMKGLRAYSKNGEPTFQSYHSAYDPDHHGFLPSGSVGIPPVNVGYLAHAYRFAKDHGYQVPENAHFWAIIGDSEFREGSLFEAIPDFAEREIGNLTWIVDYNRQSLDGHRITNREIMKGNDDKRIERTMLANGWEVIQVRHGRKRLDLFKKDDGEAFKNWLENEVEDYELQALLQITDPEKLKEALVSDHASLKGFLKNQPAKQIYEALRDFGGHDIELMIQALRKSQESKKRPTMVIAHTIKGWGLEMAAQQGNHSFLVNEDEILRLQKAQGLDTDTLFANFEAGSEEAAYLKERGDQLYKEIQNQHRMKDENWNSFQESFREFGEIPNTLDINYKMASYPHTQWMLGQLTAKLTRIANTPLDESQLEEKQKALSADEKPWKSPSELVVTMAPDVGTSTNLNPAMDGKIFGANETEDYESEFEVKDTKLPDLIPGTEKSDRFIRFEIAESNTMSCMGSYGKLREFLGIPLLPLMTVYDFFIKRAHDQYFYNLYWNSSFILVGTPSGVTLSPEGAQHGWKSDFQIPNQITWEPFFCAELDWILCESIRRHVFGENEGRTGVTIRGVTRGVDQKLLPQLLKTQRRFKADLDENTLLHPKGYAMDGAQDESAASSFSDGEMFEVIRREALEGAYYLIDYRGYAGYEPGDNVVNIFAMGAPTGEAITASQKLLEKGIYANVIVVTSPDLLIGNLGHETSYRHLRETLGIDGNLYLQPQLNGNATYGELATVAGRRVPMVSVHDGEPGLLDNIGSIVGVRHEALAVRRHSKSGRPTEIFKHHGLDADSIVAAVGQVLSETALEGVRLSPRLLAELQQAPGSSQSLRPQDLWSE